MAIRPVLKKLKEEINTRMGPDVGTWRDDKYTKLLEGAAYDEAKQVGLRKYWRENCIKLKPFDIPAGTRLVQKSSSGNWYGTIVVDCKAIGLINEVGHELLLDKPASLSDYCKNNQIPLQFDDDKVTLATLPTEILEKIYNAIVR